MIKQIHILITGFVQGVGFRKFVKHSARKLNIAGWTRNLADGTVEVVAVGEEKDLETLISSIKKGSMLSQVDNIHIEWEEVQENFSEFTVRHT